ncbi:hypothetical protein JOL79_09800 [Microbispora sp. RL4-1S]|uniref:Peptidase S26 domain-containing protein n=1 Tax=Microbispora oryzae TaxID=2806554 RepID=A0A940WHH7_9ACTN|nr:S26 family signal peptidase [Microbispora oryzae]MBP2704102.1 hypothetical protein [Microbispora oryzae]
MTSLPAAVAITAVTAAAVTGAVAMSARRVLLVVEIYGRSMEPALRAGDRVLVRRRDPARIRPGDVVVLAGVGPGAGLESSGKILIVKRAVAVAGDPVPPGFESFSEARVPPGRLLVLGDNPAESTDSRQWGFLPLDRVRGVVLRRMAL